MDDRIFELAAASGDAAAWDSVAFRELFPDQARFVARHEKRVGTLRAIGYLTAEGRPTPRFRLHFAVRHGINTPELQQLRLDLAVVMSAEAFFCLTDLCGLSTEDAIDSAEKTARTLTAAAFQQIN